MHMYVLLYSTCLEQNTMNESLEGRFPLTFNDCSPLRVSDMLNILKLVMKLPLISSEVKAGRIDDDDEVRSSFRT